MRLILLSLLAAGLVVAQAVPRLADVKKIYIEKMNNNLDQYMKSALSKKFHGRLQIVLDRSQADAIMTDANMGAQHTESATVNLTDPNGKVVLWSGTAGDRDVKKLAIKHGGENKIAENLAGQLKKAMER